MTLPKRFVFVGYSVQWTVRGCVLISYLFCFCACWFAISFMERACQVRNSWACFWAFFRDATRKQVQRESKYSLLDTLLLSIFLFNLLWKLLSARIPRYVHSWTRITRIFFKINTVRPCCRLWSSFITSRLGFYESYVVE